MDTDTLGIILVIIGLAFTGYQLYREYDWRRKEKVIAFSNYNAEHLRSGYDNITKWFPDFRSMTEPLELSVIKKAIEADKNPAKASGANSLSEDLNYALSRYEELGLSVYRGVADFETAYNLLGTPAQHLVMVLSHYIYDLRATEKRPLTWEYAVYFAVRVREAQKAEIDADTRNARAKNALSKLEQMAMPRQEVLVDNRYRT